MLFGGRSAEHDVSRATAVFVAAALDPQRYEIVPVGISTDGAWHLATDASRMLSAGRDELPSTFDVAGEEVVAPSDPTHADLVRSSSGEPVGPIDVVLVLLHGPYGEDGTVQGLLELADLPYVGAGVLGSAVAMDKIAMKRMFAAAGLAQPAYLAFRDGHDTTAFADRVETELGLPCFVKPANLGSSVGVSKAHDRTELDTAIAAALAFDEWILAEEAVAGRELEVAILGDDPPLASVAGEVIPGAEFYDYADKYEHDDAELRVPAELTPSRASEAHDMAIAAFEACRCEAMARVDFFLEEPGRGLLVSELNTIPGFTPISMYPRLWEASGLGYSELIDRLIELALARHERRARRAGRQRRD